MLKVSRDINASTRKLASGHRIGSAADDPAGMAVSIKLKRQLLGIEKAGRNAADGASIVQTAEGALQEVHDMLGRIKELTVQAANDSNTPDDRLKIQDEIASLLREIDAIADRTEYNGIKLLGGAARGFASFEPADKENLRAWYVSDAFGAGTLTYEIESAGEPAMAVSSAPDFSAPVSGRLTINGETVVFGGASADECALALSETADRLGLRIAVEGGGALSDYPGGSKLALYTAGAGSGETIEISGDASVLAAFGFSAGSARGTDAKVKQNAKMNGEPLAVRTEGNLVTFTRTDGERAEIYINVNGAPDGGFEFTLPDGAKAADYAKTTNVRIEGFGGVTIQVGPDQNMELNMRIPPVTAEWLGVADINAGSVYGAARANLAVERAITRLSAARGRLGAYENRMTHISESLDVSYDNTSEARSRIFDADIALEMTRLASANIISQAGMAILAQANQRPAQMLQLLD
jgi:flagellin